MRNFDEYSRDDLRLLLRAASSAKAVRNCSGGLDASLRALEVEGKAVLASWDG
jgi:hypothetical protein